MPKTRSRRRGSTKSSVSKQQSARPLTTAAPSTRATSGPIRARTSALPAQGVQGLVMPALVAVGCWAFAYYTFLFYRDANSYLFAGLAALLALVWSISFFLRLRKWRRRR